MRAQDTGFYKNLTLKLKGKELDLSTPVVMGILNATPDSFFDGGKHNDVKAAIEHAEKMIAEGASIIDIGACSTRPGANDVDPKEEIERLIPVLKEIRKRFPETVISADTYHSEVAKAAVDEGADIINDVSGGTIDKDMFSTMGKLKVPYVLMHMKGTPLNMQQNPEYNDVVAEVKSYFEEKIKELKHLGVEQIIIDAGFGFGKTVEHNYLLLKSLNEFTDLDYPILAGISRKSMVNRIINTKPEEALNGTTVVNTLALMNGAKILRVHDIKEAKEAIMITDYYKSLKQKC